MRSLSCWTLWYVQFLTSATEMSYNQKISRWRWCCVYVPGPPRQTYKNYTYGADKKALDRAIELVHEGQFVDQAMKVTGVPKTTIWRHLRSCKVHEGPCRGAKYRSGCNMWWMLTTIVRWECLESTWMWYTAYFLTRRSWIHFQSASVEVLDMRVIWL